MRKRAFIFLFLLVLLFSFNFVSPISLNNLETLGTFSQNSTITLSNSCINSSYSNITRLTAPNSSIILNGNISMTKSGDNYNYTFSNTSDIGRYLVYGKCDENGINSIWLYKFEVTANGKVLSVAESLLYPILTGIVFFMLLVSAWLTYALPYRNKEILETGKIFINTLKYVKLMMILITQALLVWLLNVIMALSDSYASITVFYGFVSFLFKMIIGFSYPLFILVVILIGVNFFKDVKAMKLNKMFMRNG